MNLAKRLHCEVTLFITDSNHKLDKLFLNTDEVAGWRIDGHTHPDHYKVVNASNMTEEELREELIKQEVAAVTARFQHILTEYLQDHLSALAKELK